MLPKTTEAIEKYLSSGLIRVLVTCNGKKIVKDSAKTIEIIQHYPQKLAEIKGII